MVYFIRIFEFFFSKLRAKLGLKPLDVNDGASSSTSAANAEDEEKKDEFVHKPAENISDKLYMEKLREKINMMKEKRRLHQKFSKVKGLGDSDSETEMEAESWVNRNRSTESDKKKAAERAKFLEELDAEFDVGDIVENELQIMKAKAYSEKDLKGLKVEHDRQTFTEGKSVVLTLKDADVLEESNDVLVNVNMVDDEKMKKNNEIKKKSKAYNPMEEDDELEDFDDVSKNVLSKYNEEIAGVKKKSFVIGGSAQVDKFKKQDERGEGLSLDLPALKVASEFYTEEEMVQFKKTKIRKVKKKKFRADDLLDMEQQTLKKASDLGSRSKGGKQPEPQIQIKVKKDTKEFSVNRFGRPDSPDILGPDEDLAGVIVEADEAELELQSMLNKTRKLRQKEELKSTGADKVLKSISTLSSTSSATSSAGTKGSIILNDTAEFCRALGDIPTYGQSGNRDEDVDELMDFEREIVEEKPQPMEEQTNKGSWNEVDLNNSKPTEVKVEDVTILEEEPDVSVGIAGALQLAMRKGYLDKESKKVFSAPRHSLLEAKAYTIEDKAILEDDRLNRRDRFTAGPVSDFKDKDGYRPDVKLEYIDDSGRMLCPKEAFRHLSHKFHGKGSGKNKTEKRMKKLQEETLMKQMSSTDTPLGTLSLLQQKQKQTQSAFVVLSGGNKSINWQVNFFMRLVELP
ncbi:hypothetical protein CHUAL_009507 [Chamberlinius hualienensis]